MLKKDWCLKNLTIGPLLSLISKNFEKVIYDQLNTLFESELNNVF